MAFPKRESLPIPGPGVGDLKAPALPHTRPRLPSISRDPQENWMSTTDPIPRFSRLGLGGNGVVMPVPAKSQNRKSAHYRPGSAGSHQSSTMVVSARGRNCSISSFSKRSSIRIEMPPAFGGGGGGSVNGGDEFGMLSRALDDNKRISIVQVEGCEGGRRRSEKVTGRRRLVMSLTSLVKKEPSSSSLPPLPPPGINKRSENWLSDRDGFATQYITASTTTTTSRSKKVSGLRKTWNNVVASIRR